MEAIGYLTKALHSFSLNKKDCCRRDSIDPRRLAYKICTEYLHGPWKNLRYDDFEFMAFEGGLTNQIYVCSLPKNIQEKGDYPTTVLLRLYGLIMQNFKAQILESVMFSILAERGIGPKLYAVFTGGRLEEFIPSRALSTKELYDSNTSRQIAHRMAEIHNLVMPIKKDPQFIMKKLLQFWEKLPSAQFRDSQKHDVRKFLSYDCNEEIQHLRRMIEDLNPVVVFCHNDVQEGNLLKLVNNLDGDQKIKPIDFEYGSYNYRGFDIGNHFCEWMYDYSNKEPPFFSEYKHSFPSKEQQINFVNAYLESMYEADPLRRNDPRWSLEFVLNETNKLVLMSHLFWALWSARQAQISEIKFGYIEYAVARMEAYFRHKEMMT